ncbi:MAG TPA: D-aminoacyl-tRNA deacylase [bacterium]|nr:D-aminoacyl-tRNA deacylase [bacterium]
MRIVVQRVQSARVEWDQTATEPIGTGLLCLVGFHRADAAAVLEPMAEKLLHLRIFGDEAGRMNRSLVDIGGGLMLVPQFTLYADCRKGRRPGFADTLEPEAARHMFECFVGLCAGTVPRVQAGSFGADMHVHLVNDGPVTIVLDSAELGLPRT